jgi:hypothetical protein
VLRELHPLAHVVLVFAIDTGRVAAQKDDRGLSAIAASWPSLLLYSLAFVAH